MGRRPRGRVLGAAGPGRAPAPGPAVRARAAGRNGRPGNPEQAAGAPRSPALPAWTSCAGRAARRSSAAPGPPSGPVRFDVVPDAVGARLADPRALLAPGGRMAAVAFDLRNPPPSPAASPARR